MPRLPPLGARRLLILLLVLAACGLAWGQKREPRKLFPIDRNVLIDRTGRVVLSPELLDFGEAARKGEPSSPVRDPDGEGTPRHRRILHIDDFYEGLARFMWDLRPNSRALHAAYGFIDEAGKVVIPPLFGDVGEFHDGRALVGVEGKRGYIDRTGRLVIPARYVYAYRFSEGLAIACVEDHKCGYLDRDGNAAIPFKFWAATYFSEGLALVGLDGVKMAYVDRTGRVVFSMPDSVYGGEFHEGLATVRFGLRGKYGYMNRTGRTVIPAEFDEARDFSEGKALVSKDGRWGFIDRTGRVVIPLKYTSGKSFSEGLAAVNVSSDWQVPGWGYIDHEGRTVIPNGFDYAAPFSGGLAAVDRVADRQHIPDGYVDTQGRFVWDKTAQK